MRKKGEWKQRVGEKVNRRGGEEALAEDLPRIGGVHRLLPRPLFPSQGFPLNEERLVLVTALRKHRSREGRGEKKMFLLKRRIQRAVERISTLYNANIIASIPACIQSFKWMTTHGAMILMILKMLLFRIIFVLRNNFFVKKRIYFFSSFFFLSGSWEY